MYTLISLGKLKRYLAIKLTVKSKESLFQLRSDRKSKSFNQLK